MGQALPHIIKDDSVVLFIDGNTEVVDLSHPNYDRIVEALKAQDYASISSLVNVSRAIEKYSAGKVNVVNGVVMYDGNALHNALTSRIIRMMNEGFDAMPMVRFLENLMQNPDFRAVNELYGFIEATDLPITEDGHFIAYKMVDKNYNSFHANKDGSMLANKIGTLVSMPRNQVDPDKERTCSEGLHFCSQGYLGEYVRNAEARTLILKINPRDVVAIPSDYNNAKGRACQYEVIGELNAAKTTKTHSFKTPVFDTSRQRLVDDNGREYELIKKHEAAERLGVSFEEVLVGIDDGDIESDVADLDGKTAVRWFVNEELGGYADWLDGGSSFDEPEYGSEAPEAEAPETELISKREAARRLDISRSRVDKLVEDGSLHSEYDDGGALKVIWYANDANGGYSDLL